jgi:hypothetical protein
MIKSIDKYCRTTYGHGAYPVCGGAALCACGVCVFVCVRACVCVDCVCVPSGGASGGGGA